MSGAFIPLLLLLIAGSAGRATWRPDQATANSNDTPFASDAEGQRVAGCPGRR